VPNSPFLVFEFGIQTLKLARQSGPGLALRVLSSRSGLFAWPMPTVGVDWDSPDERSLKKKGSCCYLSSKTCVELSERVLLFGRDSNFKKMSNKPYLYATHSTLHVLRVADPFFVMRNIFYRARREMYHHRVASKVIVSGTFGRHITDEELALS
jgi:hypothetical protein